MEMTRCPFTGRHDSFKITPNINEQGHLYAEGVMEPHWDGKTPDIRMSGTYEDQTGVEIAYNGQVAHLYHDIKEHQGKQPESNYEKMTAAQRLHARGLKPEEHEERMTWAALHLAEHAPELLVTRQPQVIIGGGS